MVRSQPDNLVLRWFQRAPWRIMVVGLVFALLVAALLMWQWMRATSQDIMLLVSTLAITSLFSLGVGYLLQRLGWARLPSLSLTLIMTNVWAAMLTMFNVWVMAQQMFASEHDLLLSGVLLLFTAIIATSFGVFVAASVTDGLRRLAATAQQLATGDLTARVPVSGRDEVAQLAHAFNQMASQLQEAARQREELDSLRRDLVAWTSHDLRTPLTGIRAMVEALNDGLVSDDDTIRRYYRTIRADVMALSSLIDDLFELAQLDAGGLKFERDRHDVADLVSDALESFQALAQQRQIRLDGEVGEGVVPVMLNAARVSRVLANLLGNALRHAPAGGRVHVSVRRMPGGIQVEVRDTGPGFKETDLPRLFEQFYRGEQARSRSTGGAGLGLAIARGIVEAHGGRIWAANHPAGGAVVGFLLPL